MRKTMLAALIVTAASVLTVPAFAQDAAASAKVEASTNAGAVAKDTVKTTEQAATKTTAATEKAADKTAATAEKTADKAASTTEHAAHKASKHTTHKAKATGDAKVEAGAQTSGQ